jgi:predicted RNase H-like HicB family nuclease
MKYTVVLTEKSNGGIQVSVPGLPDCILEAESRDEAIRLACEAIADVMSKSEIVLVEVPQQSSSPDNTVPWEWFGSAKDDSSWDALFDDIEQKRNATRNHR